MTLKELKAKLHDLYGRQAYMEHEMTYGWWTEEDYENLMAEIRDLRKHIEEEEQREH